MLTVWCFGGVGEGGAREGALVGVFVTVWLYFSSISMWVSIQEISFKPCPNENVWRPNAIKHCLVTKHDGALTGQTILNTFKRVKCLAMFQQMFDVVQILSNTIQQFQAKCSNGKTFGHRTIFDRVLSTNISRLDKALVYRLVSNRKLWLASYRFPAWLVSLCVYLASWPVQPSELTA